MGCGWAANVYIFLYIVCACIGSSVSYLDYNFVNHKICSVFKKRELKLFEKEESAISLKELHYFDHWTGTRPFNCTLTVHAPWNYGIVAVIQKLNLRQNETTNNCIDYVQFQKRRGPSYNIFSTARETSARYCGIVNSVKDSDLSVRDAALFAHNAYVDERGELDVIISVADQRLLPNQKLDLSITFTSYKVCRNGDNDHFKECGKGSGICIWEGFFDDKLVNCPDHDCYDEGGCPVELSGKKHSSGLGTTVTIGAVVLILSLLLLFMLCLCVCRRCQVLCWSVPPSARPQRSISQANRVEMTIPNAEDSSRQHQPSAPSLLPLTSTASPVHEDKDLPPPYESLFPSR